MCHPEAKICFALANDLLDYPGCILDKSRTVWFHMGKPSGPNLKENMGIGKKRSTNSGHVSRDYYDCESRLRRLVIFKCSISRSIHHDESLGP